MEGVVVVVIVIVFVVGVVLFSILAAVIPILATVGIIGASWGPLSRLAGQQKRERQEKWASLADVLGLTVSDGALGDLVGEIDGLRVCVATFVTTTGTGTEKSTRRHTRVSTPMPHPLQLGLNLVPQHAISEIFTAFGAQDIQSGDASFDRKIVFKGHDEATVLRALGPGARAAILEMADHVSDAHYEVTDERVACTIMGLNDDAAWIRQVFTIQAKIVRELM